MWLSVLGWVAGARRWLNGEAAKALMIGAVVLLLVIGAAALYRAGGFARDASWLSQINSGMALAYKKRAAEDKRAADAAAAEREKLEEDLAEAQQRAAALEAILAKGNDPVVFPKDLAQELNR